MAFLLDSNIVSNLIRDPYGGIGQRIDAVGSANVLTSILVTSEIQYGLSKSGSGRLRANFERILHGLAVASFEPPADRVYGELRAALHKKGTPIGELDTLIAAHCLALGHVLVTDNEREFARVGGLKVENWLR